MRPGLQKTSRCLVMTLLGVLLVAGGAGCRQDMHDQPRFEPLEGNAFFADGRSSRPLVEGTVPRGHLNDDPHLYSGRIGDDWADHLPFPLTGELLARGRQRYEIFCSPCHGSSGFGDGMVIRRGFPAARSLHEAQLILEKDGYYFDVITNGFGRMQDYAAQVPPEDRWAIVAYVRALQLSRRTPADQLGPGDLEELARSRAEGATP